VLDIYIFLSRKARKVFFVSNSNLERGGLFTELTRGKSILKESHIYVPLAGIGFRKAVLAPLPIISQAEPLPPAPFSVCSVGGFNFKLFMMFI
jgi:hypothetical protein